MKIGLRRHSRGGYRPTRCGSFGRRTPNWGPAVDVTARNAVGPDVPAAGGQTANLLADRRIAVRFSAPGLCGVLPGVVQ